jgi:GntR family transcriptional regulator, transcriptional repressor for pyruvate dehydrogenase complex
MQPITSPQFTVIEKEPMFARIIKQIKSQIENGTLKPGDSLPSERNFAEMMGVNRHTLREALKVLEYTGVIEGKHGIGNVIKNVGQNTLINRISQAIVEIPQEHIFELMEVRKLMEPGIAAIAAERANEKDIERMAKTMEDFEKEFQEDTFISDSDLRLHLAITEATHNSTLSRLIEPILLTHSEFRVRSLRVMGRREHTLKEHNEIFFAIKNRQPEAAKVAMHEHLIQVEAILNEISDE